MSKPDQRSIRKSVQARATWLEAAVIHQRPPSELELDAQREERHWRRRRAARAAAEAAGMASLMAAMVCGSRQLLGEYAA